MKKGLVLSLLSLSPIQLWFSLKAVKFKEPQLKPNTNSSFKVLPSKLKIKKGVQSKIRFKIPIELRNSNFKLFRVRLLKNL
jgi:hypothetical protein